MYLGNQPVSGQNNSFKILDDISTYTLTFDGSSASVVSTSDNTITQNEHRFITGQRVTYTDGSGTAIGGLSDATVYYIIKNDKHTIKLAANASDAANGNAISLTSVGTGTDHTLNVAFDSVNTKFKATFNNGTKAQMSRAAQLTISMNGVIQEPQDTATPTNGFGFDLDSVIVFSAAPSVSDDFWGHLVANNFPTFDISDNTVDSFTGNNSDVNFTLSKTVANNQNVLVTLDGVVQYPSDNQTTRAYSVSENIITFTAAPGSGVAIQVRHIGFAGATTSSVTGFYGRTGNVALKTDDNVVVGNVNSSGIVTATTFSGNVTGTAVTATTANITNLTGTLSGVSTNFVSAIGIQSGGVAIGAGITQLNFVGTGNTFVVNGTTVDISIQSGAGGTWATYTAGIATVKSVGINTTTLDDANLTGVGNSFQGLYVSNGMIIFDQTLSGNHYIGTNFSGLIAGPANISGVLTVDGEYVVV